MMSVVLQDTNPVSRDHLDQPPAAAWRRPPAIQFPGPATVKDIVTEDENRFKELLIEYNINANDVPTFQLIQPIVSKQHCSLLWLLV